jgi:hypothetical protein
MASGGRHIGKIWQASYIFILIFVVGFSALAFFAGKQYATFKPSKSESQEENNLQEYATYLIGGGTMVVLFAQCVIFARQEVAMRRTAEIAEDSMTIAKWPYLYIKSPAFVTPLGGSRASVPPVFEYWMVVFGESHAVIRKLYHKLVFSESVPPPPNPNEVAWETPDHFIPQGQGWERQHVIDDVRESANESWSSPTISKRKYYFVGCAIYDDVFGNQHELAFCYWAPRAGGPGIKFGGSRYNYHRRRSEDERV